MGGGAEGSLVTYFNCKLVRTKIVGIPTPLRKKEKYWGVSAVGGHLGTAHW